LTTAFAVAIILLGIAIILNNISDSQIQIELDELKSYIKVLNEKYFGKYEFVSKVNICPGSPHPNGSQHLFQFVSGLGPPF